MNSKHVYQAELRDGADLIDIQSMATIQLTIKSEQAQGLVVGDSVTLTGNGDPKEFLVERIDFSSGADSTIHLRSVASAEKEKPELVALTLPDEELPEDDMNIYHELTQ